MFRKKSVVQWHNAAYLINMYSAAGKLILCVENEAKNPNVHDDKNNLDR